MKNLEQTQLGQYQLLDVLGRGSTAVVYRAYQPSLNRYVAVKVLLQHLAPEFETRFGREARAIAGLQHPNILPIYDFAQEGELSYFVTQYIEGGSTLAALLAPGPLDPIHALQIAARLLDALEYAHGRGVIHRDVKPSNVLLARPDWPLLADFGIARFADESRHLTPDGQMLGTAAYMAPERATGASADARSDLYSLGVVLYELVTGRVPFEATTPLAVLMHHVHQPPPPPRSFAPDLPEPVERVIARALEKDPARRFQSAAEMARAVREAIAEIERERVLRGLTPVVVSAPPRRAGYTTLELPPDDPAGGAPQEPPGALPPAPGPRRRLLPLIGAGLLALALLGVALALLPALLGGAGAATAPTSPAATAPTSPAATADAASAAPLPAEPGASPTAPAEGGRYVVQPGDTLSAIAGHFGTSVEALLAANGLSDPNLIRAGNTLIIPGASGDLAAIPTAAGAPATIPAPTPAAPSPPAPTAVAAQEPPAAPDGVVALRIEDDAWQGGYRRSGGRTYGGRTATWIYGTSTDYSAMRAAFTLQAPPAGRATLAIEGMDSEDAAKTPIRIVLNGTVIFEGANPLPNDDLPLESGTWATYELPFDAALLRAGRNELEISNLAPGAFSLPPFFMLDYAEVRF
jgi:serine/threonine-protein kinase